jgi:hypothetical protein
VIGRLRRDLATPGSLLFCAMVLGGFVAIFVANQLVRNTLAVSFQVPPLISGGIGGLGLIIVGCGLGHVHLSRRMAAEERRHEESALLEAQALAAFLERGSS